MGGCCERSLTTGWPSGTQPLKPTHMATQNKQPLRNTESFEGEKSAAKTSGTEDVFVCCSCSENFMNHLFRASLSWTRNALQ